MKFIASVFAAFIVIGVQLEQQPEEQGYGSCYEVKPICIQGSPQCVCTVTQQCFWACR